MLKDFFLIPSVVNSRQGKAWYSRSSKKVVRLAHSSRATHALAQLSYFQILNLFNFKLKPWLVDLLFSDSVPKSGEGFYNNLAKATKFDKSSLLHTCLPYFTMSGHIKCS
jgi:hypothetical protein